MKKIIICLITILSLTLFTGVYADEKVVDIKVSITTDGESYTVVLPAAIDEITKKPTVKVNTNFNFGVVYDSNKNVIESTTKSGVTSFVAKNSGTYKIYESFNANIPSTIKVKDGSGNPINGTIGFELESKTVTSDLLTKFNLSSSENVTMLDISITSDATKVASAELSDNISLSTKAPNENKAHTGNNNTWKYDIYREHKGVVECIAKNLVADADGNISFATNEFSTYAIVAKEAYVPAGGGNNNNNNYSAPKTCID